MFELLQRRRVWAVTGAGLLTMTLVAAWLLHRPYAGRTYRIGVRTNSPYSIVAADGRVSGIAVSETNTANVGQNSKSNLSPRKWHCTIAKRMNSTSRLLSTSLRS